MQNAGVPKIVFRSPNEIHQIQSYSGQISSTETWPQQNTFEVNLIFENLEIEVAIVPRMFSQLTSTEIYLKHTPSVHHIRT